MNTELIIKKYKHDQASLVSSQIPEITASQILLKIDKFGMTSNNITYVALGQTFQYFDFFKANVEDSVKINVWGIATVVKSRCDEIKVGEEIYDQVIGLTSASNLDFVKQLGVYNEVVSYNDDRVLNYDSVNSIGSNSFCFVDFAGNRSFNHQIRNAYGDKMTKLVSVGFSHFSTGTSVEMSTGENIEMFFAPDWISKRLKVDGKNIGLRRNKEWLKFLANASRFTTLEYHSNKSIIQVYKSMLQGKSFPRKGVIMTLFETNANL